MDTRIADIAHELLTNIASGMMSADVDIPDRQYIHAGVIAHDFLPGDCSEAFIVAFDGILQGVSSQQPTIAVPGIIVRCAVPLVAKFTIALIRCVPTLDEDAAAPPVSDLDIAGTRITTDAMTLAAVIVEKGLAGTLISVPCAELGIGDVSPIPSLGGLSGTTVALYVSLV